MVKQKLTNGLIVGLIVGVVGSLFSYCRPSYFEGLEFEAYDMRVRTAADPRKADPRIVMVDIADPDINWVERGGAGVMLTWPWPREIHGWITRYLLQEGAAAVVFDFVFTDKGSAEAVDTERFGKDLAKAPRTVVGVSVTNEKPKIRKPGNWAIRVEGVTDCPRARTLAYRFNWWRSRAFVVPAGKKCALWIGGEKDELSLRKDLMRIRKFTPDDIGGLVKKGTIKQIRPLKAAELEHEFNRFAFARDKARLKVDGKGNPRAPQYPYIKPPQIPIAQGATRLGVVTQIGDKDGIYRHYAPIVRHGKRYYGSLAVSAALVAYPGKKIRVDGTKLYYGKTRLPVNEDGRITIRYHGSGKAYSQVGVRHILDTMAQREEKKDFETALAGSLKTLESHIRDDVRLPRQIRARLVTLWQAFLAKKCGVKLDKPGLELLQDLSTSATWHTGRVQRAARLLSEARVKDPTCTALATKAHAEIKKTRKLYYSNPKRVKAAVTAATLLHFPTACEKDAQKKLGRITAVMNMKKAAPKLALEAFQAFKKLTETKPCRRTVTDKFKKELLLEDSRIPERFKKHLGIKPGAVKGRIFIVHAAAPGLRDLKPSPLAKEHLGGEITANFLDNLLHGEFVRRAPRWASAMTALVLCLLLGIGTFLIIALTRSALWVTTLSLLVSVVVTGSYFLLAYILYKRPMLWLDVVTPTFFGAVTWIASLGVNFYTEGQSRRFVQDALGRYTAPALVRELMNNPQLLSLDYGEKRELTVFFSDLQGFTSISERITAEQLVHLLNEYLTEMTEIVLEEDGIVDKYIGDAIMAFWGAPHEDPDHALKACRATVKMQQRLEELRPKWLEEYGEEIIARCGLNSGMAIAGNMGSKHKFNYTLMGDTVNLASRFEGANKPYQTVVMIGENTRAEIPDLIVTRELDFLAVKGKDKPVRVYELIGFKDEVTEKQNELARRSDEALEVYRMTRFEDAMALFQGIIDDYDGDGPSKLYMGRCREYIRNPPPLDWDGVYRMTTK